MIREVLDSDKEAFDKASSHPLSSWTWGEFRKTTGNKVVRFGRFEKENLVEAIQLTLHRVPFTKFKVGMFIKGQEPNLETLKFLKEYAKKENILFIKMEPNVRKNERLLSLLKKQGAVPGKTLFTPTTFLIDLSLPEENLMAGFHPKTRYNIRLAQKNQVEVMNDNSDKAFEKYLALTRETVSRQRFYAHSAKYHRVMWEALSKQNMAHLLTARFKGKIITAWILFVWHNYLYYPYGASTDEYKNVMANNLMMWEAIKFGKSLGLNYFDLWGREEGKGFTKFKEGYNPEVVEFLGTWDLITSPHYGLYRFLEKIRWLTLRTKSKFIKPSF